MKIKEGFQLRDVCGEYVVVAHGMDNIDFSRMLHFNESATTVWKAVCDREFTLDDMVSALTAEYDVDAETARRDAALLAEEWRKAGVMD